MNAGIVAAVLGADIMRPNAPRILPLNEAEFNVRAREIAAQFVSEASCRTNIIRTLAHVPEALEAFLHWSMYFVSTKDSRPVKNSLPARQREMIIIRVGHLSRSEYELAQHVQLSQDSGLTRDEFRRVRLGADAGWDPADAALITACDDIVADYCVSDRAWQALQNYFTPREMMEVVMTAAQYVQLSIMLSSFGVQVEPDLLPKVSSWIRF
jgi:alkylhydroperoxidase family enzyme